MPTSICFVTLNDVHARYMRHYMWCTSPLLLEVKTHQMWVIVPPTWCSRALRLVSLVLQQEKGRMATDLKRLKQHFKAYEPTLKELERKYQVST